jgi:hypothetical protein
LICTKRFDQKKCLTFSSNDGQTKQHELRVCFEWTGRQFQYVRTVYKYDFSLFHEGKNHTVSLQFGTLQLTYFKRLTNPQIYSSHYTTCIYLRNNAEIFKKVINLFTQHNFLRSSWYSHTANISIDPLDLLSYTSLNTPHKPSSLTFRNQYINRRTNLRSCMKHPP